MADRNTGVRPLPFQDEKAYRFLFVAGEASGDQHGAEVVRQIYSLNPRAQIFGMGGKELKNAGMSVVVDADAVASVMGITEIAGSLGRLWKAIRTLKKTVSRVRPHLIVLIDFPDFNFILARQLQRDGYPILYFITPQLWAWRQGRVKAMRRFCREVVPIFPFEQEFFHHHGIPCRYLGHPLADQKIKNFRKDHFLAGLGIESGKPIVALLPGSRRGEVSRLLPPMVKAFRLLKKQIPELYGIIPVAQGLSAPELQKAGCLEPDLIFIEGHAKETLHAVDAAVIASGTATVEAALAGVPFLAVYKLSSLSYLIARKMVKDLSHFAMPNLIAGRPVVEELLQEQVTGEQIAKSLERLLYDKEARIRVRHGLASVSRSLQYSNSDGECTAGRVAKVCLEHAQHFEYKLKTF